MFKMSKRVYRSLLVLPCGSVDVVYFSEPYIFRLALNIRIARTECR